MRPRRYEARTHVRLAAVIALKHSAWYFEGLDNFPLPGPRIEMRSGGTARAAFSTQAKNPLFSVDSDGVQLSDLRVEVLDRDGGTE